MNSPDPVGPTEAWVRMVGNRAASAILARQPDHPWVADLERQIREIEAKMRPVNDVLREAQGAAQGFIETVRGPIRGRNKNPPAPNANRSKKVGVTTLKQELEGIMGDETLPDDTRTKAQKHLKKIEGVESELQSLGRERGRLQRRLADIRRALSFKRTGGDKPAVPSKPGTDQSKGSKTPSTAQGPPATSPGKAPPGGSRVDPQPSVTSAGRPGPRMVVGSVLKLGGHLLVQLALFFVHSKIAQLEQEMIERKWQTKVDPHVAKALDQLGPRAQALYEENPTQPVYANVTVNVTTVQAFSPLGAVINTSFVDVDYVGPTLVSRDNRKANKQISSRWAGTEKETTLTAITEQVTYSMELKFDESADEKAARVMAFYAREEAEAGRSVRKWAEVYERISSDQSRDAASKAALRAWKMRWANAYLGYTRGKPKFKELHMDALRYLMEVQTGAAPAAPAPDPSDREVLKGFL